MVSFLLKTDSTTGCVRILSARKLIFFFVASLICLSAMAQSGRNKRPRIIGQQTLTTNEEQSITIQMTNLTVEDNDDWFYPWGFTMQIYPGDHYTFNNNIITPAVNFNGTLVVPVTVNDGQDESEQYRMTITVNPINDKPVIAGQQTISTNEDQSITLLPSHLIINDPDDQVFSLSLLSGANYTLNGNTITPAVDFAGTLSIPVRVSDGKITSDAYSANVIVNPVNDPPKIIAQQSLSVIAGTPLALQLSQISVRDPDNAFPTGFTLTVLSGPNYTATGNSVTPSPTFSGNLAVSIKVNDGTADSDIFGLQVQVTPPAQPLPGKPVITGQSPLLINEDENLTLLFSHLTVSDPDSHYPDGFSMQILPGDNYSINNNTITPSVNFSGNLAVKITVSDGVNVSDPFNLTIAVRSVNDPPVLATTTQDPVFVQDENGLISLFKTIEITDVDDDSLALAEVGFESGSYQSGNDKLEFVNTNTLKGIFDSQRGILALIGKAPIAQYLQAIQSIQYRSQSLTPSVSEKSIYITVNDGQANSNKLKKQIKFGDISVALDIPTGFTPNGDRVNDTWSVKPIKDLETFSNAVVRVYTKAGLLVYESNGLTSEWDGNYNGHALPADVYFYTINLNSEQITTPLRGAVTILR